MQSFPLALSVLAFIPVPRVLQGDLIDTGQERTGGRELCFPHMPIKSSSNFRKRERDSEQQKTEGRTAPQEVRRAHAQTHATSRDLLVVPGDIS